MLSRFQTRTAVFAVLFSAGVAGGCPGVAPAPLEPEAAVVEPESAPDTDPEACTPMPAELVCPGTCGRIEAGCGQTVQCDPCTRSACEDYCGDLEDNGTCAAGDAAVCVEICVGWELDASPQCATCRMETSLDGRCSPFVDAPQCAAACTPPPRCVAPTVACGDDCCTVEAADDVVDLRPFLTEARLTALTGGTLALASMDGLDGYFLATGVDGWFQQHFADIIGEGLVDLFNYNAVWAHDASGANYAIMRERGELTVAQHLGDDTWRVVATVETERNTSNIELLHQGADGRLHVFYADPNRALVDLIVKDGEAESVALPGEVILSSFEGAASLEEERDLWVVVGALGSTVLHRDQGQWQAPHSLENGPTHHIDISRDRNGRVVTTGANALGVVSRCVLDEQWTCEAMEEVDALQQATAGLRQTSPGASIAIDLLDVAIDGAGAAHLLWRATVDDDAQPARHLLLTWGDTDVEAMVLDGEQAEEGFIVVDTLDRLWVLRDVEETARLQRWKRIGERDGCDAFAGECESCTTTPGPVTCETGCTSLVFDADNCGGCGRTCGGETPNCYQGDCSVCSEAEPPCGSTCCSTCRRNFLEDNPWDRVTAYLGAPEICCPDGTCVAFIRSSPNSSQRDEGEYECIVAGTTYSNWQCQETGNWE